MLGFLKNLFGKAPPASAKVPPPVVPKPDNRLASSVPKSVVVPAPPKAVPIEENLKGETIKVTLQGLIPKLPERLRESLAVHAKNGAFISVPVSLVIEQLPKGIVKIPYSELVRRLKPGSVPPANPTDPAVVELPLAEILGQLKPNQISRRTGQQLAPVPAEIVSPFEQNLRGKAPIGRALANPVEVLPISKSNPSAKPVVQKEDEVPLAYAPGAKIPGVAPIAESSPKLNQPVECISLPLSDMGPDFNTLLSSHFSNLGNATIRMPRALIETELKRGKLIFALSQVAAWLEPSPVVQGIGDDQKIELPLKVIAPIVFGSSLQTKPRQQVHIPESIPDVFRAQAPKPAVPIELKPVIPEVEPPKEIAVRPLTMAIEAKEPTVATTVAELVRELSELSGVDGVVAATFDGFLVSGEKLEGFSHQSFAAFGPQIFNRLLQYGRELQLGEAQVLTIYFNQKPIRLFQAGRLLVVVAGRELEPLPDLEIERLTVKLAQAKS
jgi:predicted regulator of Ras-like GTPase activity (Roadblock/LC7/MglB family)